MAEDVFIIARAVQRLGYPMTVKDILQANPGLNRGAISEGRLILIPKVSGESREAGATNSADSILNRQRFPARIIPSGPATASRKLPNKPALP